MRIAIFVALGLLAAADFASGAGLELQGKIPLPDGIGRIDHLAFDPNAHRLFVAELGNGSVAIVDNDQRRFEHRIEGLDEPQGIAYFAPLHRVYVADGRNGMVRAYDAGDFKEVGSTRLGPDADNIRIDANTQRMYVGYGDGALAILDPGSLEVLGE